ncbi:MAG TPA: sulfatase [Polyangiaceae bacterium]|nr:sulfatase [Polyangiaceae bacterium]
MSDTPATRQGLGSWAARVAAAAALLAVFELLLIAAVVAPAVSFVAGALQTWADLVGLFVVFGGIVTPLLWLLDRPSVHSRLPRAGTLLTATLGAVLIVVALKAIDRALFLEAPEFPHDVERMRQVARLVLVCGGFVAYALWGNRLARRVERSGQAAQRRIATAVLLLMAAVAMWIGHFAFARVHEVKLASLCTLAALPLVSALFRLYEWPARKHDAHAVVGLAVAVGLFGACVPGAARDHARFVVWGHSSLAGFAEVLRNGLDRDHDGSVGAWLMGGDCATGDRAIAPLQVEVPGDGIDQDCRGGDAPVLNGPLKQAVLPEDCQELDHQPDVLVVVVDALRFDALTPEVMPNLSTLRENSLFFTRAYSPTAMTTTSVTSLLSARPFADVGPKNALLDENLEPPFTAPELFTRAGYRSAAFSDVYDHAVFHRGFARGNDYWRDFSPTGVKGQLTSAAMSQGILEFLHRDSTPAFVWAHIADTHANYSLHHDAEGKEEDESVAYYRGANYVDQQLGRLFALLQQQGRFQRTIIAILADHGEELLARGRQGHGPNVFEESIHVPLVLWVPQCGARSIDKPVTLAHLTPTLGAFAGVQIPGYGLFADNGLPTVVEAVTGLNTTYKRAIISQRYKLMIDVANQGRMLFDLQDDPQELTNILPDAPERAAELDAAYQRWLDAPGRR